MAEQMAAGTLVIQLRLRCGLPKLACLAADVRTIVPGLPTEDLSLAGSVALEASTSQAQSRERRRTLRK